MIYPIINPTIITLFIFLPVLILILLCLNLLLAPAKCFGKTFSWEKLSNSGEILKITVLNYFRKNLCGWSNYSGKVISCNMLDTKMDYRGSKSILKPNIVKEQRVDGSWRINPIRLRYTLMGFERNYQINNPSNQIYLKNYSTLINKSILNPCTLTGLADS
jgi:hypothetical protein